MLIRCPKTPEQSQKDFSKLTKCFSEQSDSLYLILPKFGDPRYSQVPFPRGCDSPDPSHPTSWIILLQHFSKPEEFGSCSMELEWCLRKHFLRVKYNAGSFKTHTHTHPNTRKEHTLTVKGPACPPMGNKVRQFSWKSQRKL